MICRDMSQFVNELHIPDPGHNLTSSELLKEQAIAKESELCSAGPKPSSTEETRVRPFRTPADPVCCTKEIIPMKERKWKDILACRSFKGYSLSASISNLVMKGARTFSDKDWLFAICEGSNKTRFEHCESSEKSLVKNRARTQWWNHDGT